MVTEENYTGDAVTITDSGGSTCSYPKASVMIQLLGRDALIGVPLLDTFPRQVRKAMWEKMNREFAGAVVTRAHQARRNQELLLSRLKEEGGITKEFESSCGSDMSF